MEDAQVSTKENKILCKTAAGVEVEADLLRLTRFLATFEVRNPHFVFQVSESLPNVSIVMNHRAVYSGRAVITNVLNTGMGIVCEATLEDTGLDPKALQPVGDGAQIKAAFADFLGDWGKNYRIQSEFKVLIADMASFLTEMRLWFEQAELAIRALPAGQREKIEHQLLLDLHPAVVASLNALFEKFEYAALKVRAEDKPAHHTWVRRLIHPLMLVSPFADRTYQKPLGYAGDYEMVNMILREPFDGATLFAKALNGWFISQPPAEAHRNRITYLTEKLAAETARMAAQGKRCKVFNLGCGPAREVQNYLEQDIADRADLTLLDFNDETLAYTKKLLGDLKKKNRRKTGINMIKKSVVQVLKGGARSSNGANEKYDFVYCAGLFDYLPDNYCLNLMNIFYDMLAPGGLLVATNVDAVNPIREMLDYVLDWNLIYRSGAQLAKVAPDKADRDNVSVYADVTSVNIYLEVRKPA